ncbi:MAG: hypothetical protein CSA21_00815 [Deltaproteobacteria bacterium]|nr:MAG: hypothetical protein CSA21_00815 [Deltaproteobacteria bacterium]
MTRVVGWVVLTLLLPFDAWALQNHGEPEGMVVHQLAHLQYIAALGYLFWDIRRSGFVGKGWAYLQRFCLLLMLWNAIAFTGHFMGMLMGDGAVDRSGGYLASYISEPLSFAKLLYLLTTLDHLVMVPALFFLYLAMRFFYTTALADEQKDGQ